MRALFLCPNVPYPPLNGGHHRNLGLMRCLARVAQVEVLAVGEPASERAAAAREALSREGLSLDVFQPTGPGSPERDGEGVARLPDAAAHFRSPQLAAELARRVTGGGYGLAHVEEVVMAQYLDLLPRPRVLDRQKIDWAYHEGMAAVPGGGEIEHLREAARFRWWEPRLVGAFERVLVPGAGDRELLAPLHDAATVEVVPIGIADDLEPPPPGPRGVERVLLYGALDYGPNVAAQEWFFSQVWPRLRSSGIGVRIVGSGRPPLLAAPPPGDPGVELRGFVSDVRAELQGPAVLVVPLRVGGGARTKILEALACELPVVASAVAAENLGLVPGRDFLLAETAAETAEAVLRLRREPALAAALGRSGRARALEFRWSRLAPRVEALYREVAAAGPTTRARWPPAPDDWGRATECALRRAEQRRRPSGPLRRSWERLRRSRAVARLERWSVRGLDALLQSEAVGRSARALARRLRQGGRPE